MSLDGRFWDKVDLEGPVSEDPLASVTTPCWLWLGKVDRNGYGLVKIDGVMFTAHRAAWELERGPFPEGLESDHLCRVRNCVRPDHIEPVTRRENILRGDGSGARAVRTGKCFRGHEDWTHRPGGGRRCNECARERARAFHARRRAAV
jgi:hypothetical protein